MIRREYISAKRIVHGEEKADSIPVGCSKIRAKLLLEHEMIVNDESIPKYNHNLIEGMENKVKDAILRKIYGEVTKRIYEKRGEVLIMIPARDLNRAIEAFNYILDCLPNHAQFSRPEMFASAHKEE